MTVVWPSSVAQQHLEQRGLSRSNLAGDHDEPGVAVDPEAQVVERLAVHAAGVEEVGIRAQRERSVTKLVEALVHDSTVPV